jgi:hypothetical protein
MSAILADLFGAELIRRPVEVLGKRFHATQVSARRSFGIVPAHEFIDHGLA